MMLLAIPPSADVEPHLSLTLQCQMPSLHEDALGKVSRSVTALKVYNVSDHLNQNLHCLCKYVFPVLAHWAAIAMFAWLS